ncbi:hypothetical protein CHUAL_009565 [Chamberlinius hualienensis]
MLSNDNIFMEPATNVRKLGTCPENARRPDPVQSVPEAENQSHFCFKQQLMMMTSGCTNHGKSKVNVLKKPQPVADDSDQSTTDYSETEEPQQDSGIGQSILDTTEQDGPLKITRRPLRPTTRETPVVLYQGGNNQ